MGTNCGHICCDQRGNPYHAHGPDPDTCLICETVRDTGRIPTVVITTERATDVQHETPA